MLKYEPAFVNIRKIQVSGKINDLMNSITVFGSVLDFLRILEIRLKMNLNRKLGGKSIRLNY